MLRALPATRLVACLVLIGMVNFVTACCRGDTLVLQVVTAGFHLADHGHDHDATGRHKGPAHQDHDCYKAGGQDFLASSDPSDAHAGSAECPPWLVALPAPTPPREFGGEPRDPDRPDEAYPSRAAALGRWLL